VELTVSPKDTEQMYEILVSDIVYQGELPGPSALPLREEVVAAVNDLESERRVQKTVGAYRRNPLMYPVETHEPSVISTRPSESRPRCDECGKFLDLRLFLKPCSKCGDEKNGRPGFVFRRKCRCDLCQDYTGLTIIGENH